MILLVRTDSPTAELYLHDGLQMLAEEVWQADRTLARDLLGKLEALVHQKGDWKDLTGIVAFEGPGSFTGLRIGLTVLNTLADSLAIPIVGAQGDEWIKDGIDALARGENSKIVMPFYGAEPNITKPKK